jgi:uncharacterized membrane protein
MARLRLNSWLPPSLFLIIALLGVFVHARLWGTLQSDNRPDVYYSYLEGRRLAAGENPYARILLGDMRSNDKYATYFPLFYLLSAGVQWAGLEKYPDWIAFWRVIFLICNLGIAYLIFRICVERDQLLLGVFGALFWLLNRWTLNVTLIDHLDFPPLFLFLLSLKLVPRRFSLACLLFGLSLALKQIAILALPLYLIWSWQIERPDRLRHLLKDLALIIAIPLLVSIPFLVWNAEGYVKSLFFSVSRLPDDHFDAPSLDALFGIVGLPARLPMIFFLGLTYTLAILRRLPKYASNLLVMAIIFGFSSVLYRQYLAWLVPFLPLTILELIPDGPMKIEKSG